MKISKLFHWLYALVMLLPIFAIGSTCLISTFNMSSKEETEIHYRYQTNEVNSNEDIINGNMYLVDLNEFNHEIGIDLLGTNNLTLYWENNPNYNLIPYYTIIDLSIDDSATPLYMTGLYFNEEIDNNVYYYGWFDNYNRVEVEIFDVHCMHDGNIDSKVPFVVEVDKINLNPVFYKFVSPITDLSLIPIDYVETHNVSAEDVFYRSVDKVVQSPLFNWAYNSNLLGVPVSYIGGIFGLASNSVINVLLCYWLAISIIWLVFDILMFVPLLVHKSIDKMRF